MSNVDRNQMTVIFKGEVQGVGFRAAVRIFAKELGLFGSAQNLADGSVKVIVQGEKFQYDALIKKLKNRFDVTDTTISFSLTKDVFTDFFIF